MRLSVSRKIRPKVANRAGYRCEYCLIGSEDVFLPHEIDHIISLKHGGDHHKSNFALSCFACNRSKGSDIATIVPPDTLVRLFNPRTDRWEDHFELEGSEFIARTEIGWATISLLKLNHPDRILERRELMVLERYPAPRIQEDEEPDPDEK